MSLSTLPLSYCTNVHPGKTIAEVISGLETYTAPARRQFGKRIAAGLWLAASVVEELVQQPEEIAKLQAALASADLICYTLNAFPYGDFHSERVKENVYLPDWTDPNRLQYTLRCAHILSQLMPVGTEGSISTVPLGFKGFQHSADFESRCIEQLLTLARELDQLHDETGQVVRLAIEPEPCCILETTAETLAFFERLFSAAERQQLQDAARRHLGVCYDVCHQSVEFEDVAQSIQQLAQADIRINKVHITCALQLDPTNPAALRQLADFVEPRYLHQTIARSRGGEIVRLLDLTAEACSSPSAEFQQADQWRVHFHVPVHQEQLGELQTTRADLKAALGAVSQLLYAPHLEVETYTWGVLPGEQSPSLVQGLVSELTATDALLSEQRTPAASVETA
ncbi:metabolite traffic protein EboE [Planctomicrobium piriforme]|uniref:Xylose isomerase-like TIM barrel n=1 Tax=Planctomicrobium piriforme TaxID=1576369 RepID=A0A1I3RM79_9PLAN|nr:metabolite traffic protein EboE [Planctomicrobium piriforme]SFJ46357.1 Xylose isomerase-like TIM barrel [Planctomicrobium piriforme]